MSWFNKRKIKVNPEAALAARAEESRVSADMRNIDKAARTLEELNHTFAHMWTNQFRSSVLYAAQENQRKIENFNQYYKEVTARLAETGYELEIDTMKREKEVIEGTSIQYQNTRGEDVYQDGENRLYFVMDEAANYQNVPGIMRTVLEDYTPSDIVFYHATDILPELRYFIRHLESALESGQKLKADVCKVIFSYVTQVVLKKELAGTEESIQKKLKFRKRTMEQFADIIDAVDKIYYLINDLKYYETRVNYNRNEFRKLQKEKNEIPAEALESINEMGFDNLLKKDPGDVAVLYYQSLFHEMQTTAVWLKITELYRDDCRDKLFLLQVQFSQTIYEIMKRFCTQDDSAENKISEELSARTQEIQQEFEQTVSFQELEKMLGSELAAACDVDELDI